MGDPQNSFCMIHSAIPRRSLCQIFQLLQTFYSSMAVGKQHRPSHLITTYLLIVHHSCVHSSFWAANLPCGVQIGDP